MLLAQLRRRTATNGDGSMQQRDLTKAMPFNTSMDGRGINTCKFCFTKLVLYRCTRTYIGREGHGCPIFTDAKPAASHQCGTSRQA